MHLQVAMKVIVDNFSVLGIEHCLLDGLPDTLSPDTVMKLFGLGSSMYTILVGHLPHGPSILKTAKERLDYAHTFKLLALEGKFPDTSEIIGGDIIKDCWDQKIRSAEEAHRRLVELLSFRRTRIE
jgi:hypothetical protein